MNAEFRRNLWLEVSPRRLAWAGVTLALVYGLAAMAGGAAHALPGARAAALGVAGMLVFAACAVLWGARAAGGSVLGEIADRTWDFQRLSALTPWAFTWGKLFGATSLAWLCGLTGLAVVAYAGAVGGEPDVLWTLVFLASSALLLQAICLGAALIGVRKARVEGRLARAGGVLGGLFAAFLLLSFGNTTAMRQTEIDVMDALIGGRGIIPWWGLDVSAPVFRALATAAFAAWTLAGAWRLMRLELQMRNAPIVWPAFLVFLAFLVAGFSFPAAGSTAGLLAASLAVAMTAYAAAFAEPADRIRVRQFVAAVRAGDVARALPLTPVVLAPTILAALLVLAAAISLPSRPFGAPDWAMGAAALAFLIRDLAVITFFRFGPRPARGDFGAVIALVVLYAVGSIVGGQLPGEAGGAIFGASEDAPFVSLAAGLVQAGIAWALAIRRILAPAAPAQPITAPAAASD